jgi:hypothetical protein
LKEDINTKNKITLLVIIFLIGLILFVIGIGYHVNRNIQFYLDIEPESSNLEVALTSGIYNIGLAIMVFGIAYILSEHISTLNPSKLNTLNKLIILLAFLFTLILEIMSKVIYYNAVENIQDRGVINQIYLSSALNMIAKFGLTAMFIIVLVYLINLFNNAKYKTIKTTPTIDIYPPPPRLGG